jgi:hypothetical protein
MSDFPSSPSSPSPSPAGRRGDENGLRVLQIIEVTYLKVRKALRKKLKY